MNTHRLFLHEEHAKYGIALDAQESPQSAADKTDLQCGTVQREIDMPSPAKIAFVYGLRAGWSRWGVGV
ncbi:hypothetical protein CERSUDRAFT_80607, partial [Gelatoporia subvermispora B]